VGSGSHPTEYALVGASFRDRGMHLDAGIAALRRAWAGSAEPHGYRIEPSGPVPVWIGGSSPAALRRAGKAGDGWVPLFVDPEAFADGLVSVREVAADAGRSPDAIVPAVVMVASICDDQTRARAAGTSWLSSLYGIPAKAFERHIVAGSDEHCAEAAAAYVDAGAAHVIVLVADDDALGQFRALAVAYERVASRVLAAGVAAGTVRTRGQASWGRTAAASAHERAEVRA
jgi:alkanesulfonate monooxygenase SsuD/methylene tetrahydromethanopterin reductase-like flavin-dependent oxidoreductase (luciferase family)